MESDKSLSQSLLELQDKLNNVLFTMDFYRQAVDTIISSGDMGPPSTERQRNGLALYGDWIVENIESIEQSMDQLRIEIEKKEQGVKEKSSRYFLENVA